MSTRTLLSLPQGTNRLLLHSCCAPCAGEIMESLSESKIDYTVFFYNPNIHPQTEYELRKAENKRFAQQLNVPFIDGDYDSDNWFKRVQGLENEPERGKRCTVCFALRLERTALFAYQHGFSVLTSSLGISRWKNLTQVNECGIRAAQRYPGLTYWTFNWRKQGGSQRGIMIAKREGFYQQVYCGCVYSLRDAKRRQKLIF